MSKKKTASVGEIAAAENSALTENSSNAQDAASSAKEETAAETAAMDQTVPSEPEPKNEKSRKKLVISIIGIALLVVIIVTGIVLYFYSQRLKKDLDIDTFYSGISVQGIDLEGKTKKEATALLHETEKELRDPIQLTITFRDKTYSYTEDDFDFSFDTDEIIDEAYQYGREGNIWIRYYKVKRLKKEPKDFEITHELSNVEATVEKIVKEVALDNDCEPQNATIGEFSTKGSTVEEMFSCVEGTVGIEVDQDKLLADCMEVLDAETKSGTVTVEAEEIPFEVSAADLMKHIKPLGSFSTTSTNTSSGNHNMAVALGKINGKILQPGETFSFNGTVGRRTVANGFREAGVIQNGELVDGLGGGVCQASTTVYGAAIRSGMTVVERGNHRWPSSYVAIGQDAMVSWGSQDMKFRNDSDYPIYIKAYMSGRKLYVSMYGDLPDEWDKIEIASWETETLKPGATRYVNDATLEKGKTEVKIQARNGHKASAQRIYYKDGNVVKKESLPSSYYRPVSGVVRVGTAEAAAPEVPVVTPPAEE